MIADLPRALAAVDAQHPEGTVGREHNDYTVLQQHCAFFDRNGDGVIYPQETYQGFRALGYTPTISVLAAIVINGSFSYPTYDVMATSQPLALGECGFHCGARNQRRVSDEGSNALSLVNLWA